MDLSAGVMWECFSVQVTARASAFSYLLKVFNLCERKSVVKRVTIVETTVDEGSGDSDGSGKVKSVTNATEVTNVIMADARNRGKMPVMHRCCQSKHNQSFSMKSISKTRM